MRAAIEEQELNALVEKYRRGKCVLWEELAKEAETKLFGFYGVGRINALPAHKITAATRYVHTKGELSAIFGVTRTTFQRWEAAELITARRITPPQRLRLRYKWVYDAADILKQLEKQLEKQRRGEEIISALKNTKRQKNR